MLMKTQVMTSVKVWMKRFKSLKELCTVYWTVGFRYYDGKQYPGEINQITNSKTDIDINVIIRVDLSFGNGPHPKIKLIMNKNNLLYILLTSQKLQELMDSFYLNTYNSLFIEHPLWFTDYKK